MVLGRLLGGEILEPGKAWDDLRFSRPTRTHEGVQPRAKAMNGPQADAAAMPSSSEGGSIVPPMQHALNVTCKAVLRLSKLLRNKETASRKWEEYTAQMKQQVIKERQKFERDMEKLTSDIRMQSRPRNRPAWPFGLLLSRSSCSTSRKPRRSEGGGGGWMQCCKALSKMPVQQDGRPHNGRAPQPL